MTSRDPERDQGGSVKGTVWQETGVISQGRMQPESAKQPRTGGGWVFWLLFALAAGAFAPCVLLPVWRDYEATKRVEQVRQAEVQRMQAEIDRQRRLAYALRSDASVIARAAQRELEYIKPGELRVDVVPSALSLDAAPPEPFIPDPVGLPTPVKQVVGALPELDYDAVFCDPSTRTLITAMSGGVLMAAFALFPPRRKTHVPTTPG